MPVNTYTVWTSDSYQHTIMTGRCFPIQLPGSGGTCWNASSIPYAVSMSSWTLLMKSSADGRYETCKCRDATAYSFPCKPTLYILLIRKLETFVRRNLTQDAAVIRSRWAVRVDQNPWLESEHYQHELTGRPATDWRSAPLLRV